MNGSRAPLQLATLLLRQYRDVRRARREANAPQELPLLSLEITAQCNARCLSCGFPSHYPAQGAPLTTEEWLAVIDAAAALKTLVISLGGGEPLLHRDCETMIRRIASHGMTTLLHTNGSRLDPERCRRLAENRRLAVAISLDSHRRERHDHLRQLECFDTLIAAARYFVRHAPHVRTSFTVTISAENFRDIPAIMTMAHDIGVHTVRFTPLHENLQHRFRAANSFSSLHLREEDLPELRACVDQVCQFADQHGMITNSRRFLKNIPDYFLGRVDHACYAGFFYCSIDPCGQLFPCYDLQSGLNLRAAGGLTQAFRSPEMDALRQQVLVCQRRCWNIGTAEPSLRIGDALWQKLPQLMRETWFYLR